jgi:hypothetical protein
MSSHKGITLLENTPVATRYAKVSETMNGASSTTLTFQGSEQLFLDRGVFVEVDVPVVLTRKTALTGNDPKRQTTFKVKLLQGYCLSPVRDPLLC